MSLFDKIKSATTAVVSDNIKNLAKSAMESVNLRISVPADYIQGLLEKTQPDGVSELLVTYTNDEIVISGKAKKALIRIPFEIRLKPDHSNFRTLVCNVARVTPMDLDWINKRIFQIPPMLSYENRQIFIDLNGFPLIEKVNLGKITNIELEGGHLWVTLGI